MKHRLKSPDGQEIRFVLAPLAGLSHGALRRLIGELGGCDLYFGEMLSSDAIAGGADSHIDAYLDPGSFPERHVHQLVGFSEDTIVRAAEIIVERSKRSQVSGAASLYGIDINMGCSAPEITRKGGGVAWMSRKDETMRLLGRMRTTIHVPLSIKIRLGAEENMERLIGFCTAAQDCGVDYITIHPRTSRDPRSRPARKNQGVELARSLDIPVILNGDIGVPDDLGYLDSVSALMVGREALRKPWVFSEFASLPAQSGFAAGGLIDRLAIVERFDALVDTYVPPVFHASRTRLFYQYFVAPFPFGHSIGSRLQNMGSAGEMRTNIRAWFADHESDRFVPYEACAKRIKSLDESGRE